MERQKLSVCILMSLGVLAFACPIDKIAVGDGLCMPMASDGDVMKHTPSINDTTTTARWLAAGGRGIDTAWSYDHGGYGHSQRQDGIAIKASGIARSEIWVTSKIPCGATTAAVLALVQYDLDQLVLDSIDLLLIHTPTATNCTGAAAIASTWIGMEAALKANKVKSIGVSNFKSSDLEALAKASGVTVPPAVNQILLHVGQVDQATVQYCAKAGIVVEAYSPLGHPNGGGKAVYDMPAVVAIAKAHNVSGAQVGLKWLVQNGEYSEES